MHKRNPESPWNPAQISSISPKEYEEQVLSWLKNSVNFDSLSHFDIQHLRHLNGSGGDYEFDVVVNFTLFHGAKITILVECKRYARPVEREKVLALWAKLQDVGAHKAIMFATSGFQSGALTYAKNKGIATVIFVDGDFLYETKSMSLESKLPSWFEAPKYAGILTSINDIGSVSCSSIWDIHTDAL